MINLLIILLMSLSWAVDVKVRSECNVANSDCIMTDQLDAAQTAEETLKGNARMLGENKRRMIKSMCDSMYGGFEESCGEKVFNEYGHRIQAAKTKLESYQQQVVSVQADSTKVVGQSGDQTFENKIKDLIAKYEETKSELQLVVEHQNERLQTCLKSANRIGQRCVPPRLVPAGSNAGDSESVMAETWSETFSNVANKASSMLEEVASPVVHVPEVKEENGTAVATAGLVQSETIDSPEIVQVRERAVQTYDTVENQSSTRSERVSGDVQQIESTVSGLRSLLESMGQNNKCSGFTSSDCDNGGVGQQSRVVDPERAEQPPREQTLTRTATGGDPTARKTGPTSTFIDPTNTGPNTTGKSELAGNTPTTTSTGDALSKTGTTTTTPTSSGGGFLSSLGSMFGGGAQPSSTSYDSGSGSYDDGSGASNYYSQNASGNLSMEDSNYGNINSRYNNNNANMKMTPEQQRQMMLNGGNYANGNQQGNGGSNNTGFGQFGNSGNNNNNNNAKNKGTIRSNNNGNKQVFSNRNVSNGGVTGGIFGASKKDENFNRRIASLKAQGGKDAVFDPDKYNPTMKAQAHAMARGTGRVSGKMGTMVSCSNTQGKIQTLPGACDIRVHVGTADVFRVISPSVKSQLGQEI